MAHRRLLPLFLLMAVLPARAQEAAPRRARNVQFDMPSFLDVVRPMRHGLGGRMPLLVWSLPMPAHERLIWSRQSGALRKAVDELAKRGIAPMVLPPGEGSLALARTLAEAGRPIYLSIPNGDTLTTAWKDRTTWVSSASAAGTLQAARFPCLPMADAAPGVEFVEQRLRLFHDAGLQVAGAFFDDEGPPQPSASLYASQKESGECRGRFPPGALDDPEHFAMYTLELRADLIRRIMVDPVHRLFPGAIAGNFGECSSTAAAPFRSEAGKPYPPLHCGGDFVAPVLYGKLERPISRDGQPVTQLRVDQTQFQHQLKLLSVCAPAARAYGQRLVPYLAQRDGPDVPESRTLMSLSDGAWQELHWHVWLRGADGIFLFNGGINKYLSPVSASFRMVETARQVFDQVLEYREFLDKGQVMTDALPDIFAEEPVWSGLRLPDRCLVRAFTPGPAMKTVQVKAYETVTVTVDAPPEGATYLIGVDGKVQSQTVARDKSGAPVSRE